MAAGRRRELIGGGAARGAMGERALSGDWRRGVRRGRRSLWWDKRRPLERLALPHVLGFLLNVPSRVTLGALALPLCRPHWLCVRPFGDTFYNLDSKLPGPAPIGAEPQLRQFLRAGLALPE
ncbi:josephin-2-like [Passer montanus]|uniref:josephin-2-like n=1 Tax=Passer montanus TaxID=9160 RepID=UPI001960526B|nr:josephin-2-like [Passer montanus]